MENNSPDYIIQLWHRFLRGDNQALSSIYLKYINELYDYGCKFSNDKSFVKDCIQEVFISLIKNRKNLSETSHLKGYLLKAVKRKIISEIIKARKFEEVVANGEYRFEVMFEEMHNENYEQDNYSKKMLAIKQAIEALTSRQKEALYLRFYQGLDHAEIAEVLHLSNQSSRALLSRALKKVKKIIVAEKRRIRHSVLNLFL